MGYNNNTERNQEDPLLNLTFYHHTIVVRCSESLVVQKLRDEFHFFLSEETASAEYNVELIIEKVPEMPSMVAVKLLENAVIYRLGQRQYVDYFGEALTIWDDREKSVKIYSPNAERLFELGFLAIHSILGQRLDLDGLCRLHAVAVSINNVTAAVMLPSKGGKSTLLKNVLENPEVKVVSDDMPLVDRSGSLRAFPAKMSLEEIPQTGALSTLSWHQFRRHHYPPKFTASLSQMKDRLERSPEKHRTLLISGYRLSNGQSILTHVPKWKMVAPMLEHMILGLGLPQILEMFLKFDFSDFFKLARHALVRSWCAFQLVRRSRTYYFYMGPDKSYNAQLLLDLIYEHQAS